MAKLYTILKYSLYVFNALVAVIGILALIFTIYVTVDITQYNGSLMVGGDVTLMWFWLITFAIFGLAGLGMYGTYRKKRTQLIVFCVLMWIITVILVCQGITFAVIYQKVRASGHGREIHLNMQLMFGMTFGGGAFTLVGGVLSRLMVHYIK